MTEQTVIDARSDAMAWRAAARERQADSPPSTDQLDCERVQTLPLPGGRVAAALLSVTGWHPVPLDPARAT